MKKTGIIFASILLIFLTSCSRGSIDIVNTENQNYENNSGPQMIVASFDELKRVKEALESMDSDEFMKYLKENHRDFIMNGMYDYESTKKILEELKSTTVLLSDNGNIADIEFSFYRERNEVHVFYSLLDNKRAACYSFTPNSQTNDNRSLSLNENLVFEKNIIKNGVAVKVYSSSYADRGFHAEIKNEGTYISFWINQKQTIDEFEKDFEKLKLVKIGDLLSETYTESTQSESVLEEITTVIPYEITTTEKSTTETTE